MDDGRQSDSLFAKLGARQPGMRELLADAIADLPERERLVFALSYYEELETSEIALVLVSVRSSPLEQIMKSVLEVSTYF
jgi:DNA-directed RNA polymerase specialized sigma subunit